MPAADYIQTYFSNCIFSYCMSSEQVEAKQGLVSNTSTSKKQQKLKLQLKNCIRFFYFMGGNWQIVDCFCMGSNK